MKLSEIVKHKGKKGIPHDEEPGSSLKRKTGTWRIFTPTIDKKKCVKCLNCWLYCPEGAVSIDKDGLSINHEICKGCLICLNECKLKAISL